MEGNLKKRNKKKALTAILVTAIFILSAMIFVFTPMSSAQTSNGPTPWTYPTTTMQEPNYTGGVYKMAATNSIEHLNIWETTDLYSFMLLDEIYDSPVTMAPNETIIPWLATSWMEKNVTGQNITTFDPVTGNEMPVNYEWVVHIRPGVQWTDWSPANQNDTYVFSNTTVEYINGQKVVHTFKSFPSLTMRTYYVQSADFVLSWEILESAMDFSGSFINVVNVIPINNLTVQYDLSAQSATFVTYTLETSILPYHIWVHHDWSTTDPAAFNYTGQPNGYDTWNMNYSTTTYTASGLVGTGPFMMYNNYGEPYGQWVPDEYWELYVNPHYFVQYVPSLRQWTPKFYELYVPQYLSLSAAVTAQSLGQVYTIEEGVPPTFIPTVNTMKDTYIYEKPSTSYGYIQINSYSYNAPFNFTSVRQALNYATNKAYIATVIDEGYDILGQPVVPVSDSVWHNFSTPQYSYNPSLAMSLLNSTPGMKYINGQYYYKGKPVTANMQITVASEDPLGVEAALVIAKEWDSIGIPTTVTQEAFTTLVSNLITYSYQMINLGITGIYGDPTGDFMSFYNTQGIGTGFYLGPFTNITLNGVNYTGQQITDLMNNLTVELNTITNFTQRIAIADEIEGIAAWESTMINLGYPVDILPFTNSTFTGIIRDTLPYSSFMWWNFLSLHLKTKTSTTTTTAPPVSIPLQLSVAVVSPTTVYYNGQYGNITISVRNQFGQPVSGATVTVGYSPQGALLNISSDTGTTNSQGIYTWEFKVLSNNPLTYTSDYMGEINISASAILPSSTSYTPGLGYTYIDVAPEPVAYNISGSLTLINNTGWKVYNITIYNPLTGLPISGYKYTIQTLSGAVELLNTSSAQSITQTTSYNPIYGFGFQYVYVNQVEYNATLNENVTVPVPDYNITSITGITGSNGLVSVKLAVNPDINYTKMGSTFESYIFIGNYAAGAPLTGEEPYAVIGEVTSASNPNGFGVLQPAEIPISVAQSNNNVNIAISTSPTVTYDGSVNVTVTVTNSSGPVAGYTVTLVSQNALGANRGFFTSTSGQQIESYNPNSYFGSRFLPGIVLTTNSSGVAQATFTPELYSTVYAPNGTFVGFQAMPYSDHYLVPEDEFQISAIGSTGNVATTTIVSQPYEHIVYPKPVVTAHPVVSNVYSNVAILYGNSTYGIYINGTLNTPAGPSVGNIPISLSVNYGSLSETNFTLPSSGSYLVQYTAPSVYVITPIELTILYNGTKTVETFYVIPMPSGIVHTVTVTQYVNKTVNHTVTVYTSNNTLLYVFVVLTIIFIITTIIGFGRRKKPPTEIKQETTSSEQTSQGEQKKDDTKT